MILRKSATPQRESVRSPLCLPDTSLGRGTDLAICYDQARTHGKLNAATIPTKLRLSSLTSIMLNSWKAELKGSEEVGL